MAGSKPPPANAVASQLTASPVGRFMRWSWRDELSQLLSIQVGDTAGRRRVRLRARCILSKAFSTPTSIVSNSE